MVATDPRMNESRKTKEAVIRVIDLVIYFGVFCSGSFAVLATPATVSKALAGLEWLIVLWGILLLLGGLLGFVGRLSRVWAIEVPGTGAAISGCLIYAFVLGYVALSNFTIFVAVILVVIATLTLVRRYIELQIFTYDPGSGTFLTRVRSALRRRTENAVPREH
ncbi:hypothetical protein [Subtercola endophyticus]|uniref:hypothetical protein n=1 Tax=Subtercola endophyticus TaxID=2895559 RepID=UPI001E4DE902|nr:hypothetical protein [Subtercola endophyticus]UFS59464.1 hypothetical protein LQ955_01295 [Subtercola endophyticus]